MSHRKVSSVALAAAAAVMFTTVSVSASAEEAMVKCDGANACKGQSACSTATSSCKGENACKGKGYLELTKQECDKAKANAATEKTTAPEPEKKTG